MHRAIPTSARFLFRNNIFIETCFRFFLPFNLLHSSIDPQWWYRHVNTNTLIGAAIFLGHPYIWVTLIQALNIAMIIIQTLYSSVFTLFDLCQSFSNTFRKNLEHISIVSPAPMLVISITTISLLAVLIASNSFKHLSRCSRFVLCHIADVVG